MRRAPLVLLLVVVACVPSERGERAVSAPTPVAGAKPGGTLRVAITPPDGIDPTGAHEPSGELITQTMCDQLIAFDPVSGLPRPSLAASWTVADGGANLFVRLRSDARFSDGSPVTAEDVQYTLSRLANETFASPSASLVSDVGGYGFVHGEIDTRDETLRRTLFGVSIVDARTVSISLEEPHADFFRVLAHPATSPVPRKIVERDAAAFARAPVCAGPYKLAGEPPAGGPIRLVRAEGYRSFNPTLSRAVGYADQIEFHVFPSRATATAAFRRGAVDLAPQPEDDRRPTPAGARILSAPTQQTEFIGFPTTTPPFNDRRVRRALAMVLDREKIARTVYEDRRSPASTFLPPGLDPSPSSSCPSDVDVTGARALLRAARVDPAALRPTIAFNDEFANRTLVTEVARQWRETLGIRARPQAMPWERYRSLSARPQGTEAVFRFGWSPPVPSAEHILAPLFTVDGIGLDNWSRYSSRDLNDALDDMNEEADAVARSRHAGRAHEILCEDMPMVPLVRAERRWLVRAGLAPAVEKSVGGVDGQLLLRELFFLS